MTRNEHAQYQNLEQVGWCFVRILLWLVIGMFGLNSFIGILFYGTDTAWNHRPVYYSVIAMVIAAWRIKQNFAAEEVRVRTHLMHNLPSFLRTHIDK